MKRNHQQIDQFVFLAAKAVVMAAKLGEEHVVSALKSLSSDGLLLPEEDRQNIEVLIEEYFDNSGDDTGNEDEQVKSLYKY